MCAGVCPRLPGLPESTRGLRGGAAVRESTAKRRAESASPFCAVPEKKRCRADSPPRERRCPASLHPGTRCRKRPSSPEPFESLPEPPNKVAVGRGPSLLPGGASGKFDGERGEVSGRRGAESSRITGRTTENFTEVTLSGDVDVGDAFNSFQFWRAPLPELDLSLLDPPASGGAETRDSTEAMET